MSDKISRMIFPYDKEEVFNAVLRAIQDNPYMKVGREDICSGIIYANVGLTLFSWGESVAIKVLVRRDGNTEVRITHTNDIEDNSRCLRNISELKQDIMFLLR